MNRPSPACLWVTLLCLLLSSCTAPKESVLPRVGEHFVDGCYGLWFLSDEDVRALPKTPNYSSLAFACGKGEEYCEPSIFAGSRPSDAAVEVEILDSVMGGFFSYLDEETAANATYEESQGGGGKPITPIFCTAMPAAG